ncbi:MAG TPA: sulfurtransferase [Deltaproteobacteria bacterium]|nr:sulfurtransferase [Deltaproteobacteria bacterium]
MRWKQFFTPVKSFNAEEAKQFMDRTSGEAFTLLDVRQPAEYESEHIPGATLIPLPDLGNRIAELDAGKPTIVYCAIGGRSRVASQMLAGKGFKEVFNLSGGIKAWRSGKAVGREDLGLDLFSGKESPEETLLVAYSLEEGLRKFYLSMIPKVENENSRQLFEKLAAIEVNHQNRIFDEYVKISGASVSRDEFAINVVAPAMEGGLTTEEYLKLYQPDLDAPEEVISLAMAIEFQALDLYQRAADRTEIEDNKNALIQIANEERAHLEQLGNLFDNL